MRFTLSSPPLRRSILQTASSGHGFTLLEVLVAIVVLSFGVLGVVGLQAAALQSNREARHQSIAVSYGREYADMMRGNSVIALETGSANTYLIDYPATAPAATAGCFTAACTTRTAVAQFNVSEWVGRLNAALPGARVRVCRDATPYSATDNRPQWGCSDTGDLMVVKIGWTAQSTDRSASAPDSATRPAVVLPVIPGSPPGP